MKGKASARGRCRVNPQQHMFVVHAEAVVSEIHRAAQDELVCDESLLVRIWRHCNAKVARPTPRRLIQPLHKFRVVIHVSQNYSNSASPVDHTSDDLTQ
jgi:hypothetical protein